MIAFGMGERTVTTPIGTDVTSLSWTVTHPIGASILTVTPPMNSHNSRFCTATECSRRTREFFRDFSTDNAGDRYALCLHNSQAVLFKKLLKPDQHKRVPTRRPLGEASTTSWSQWMLQMCCKPASRGDLP